MALAITMIMWNLCWVVYCCGCTCTTKKGLQLHQMGQCTPLLFVCGSCGKGLKVNSTQIPTNLKPHSCSKCNSADTTSKVTCKRCTKIMIKSSLKRHMQHHNTSPKFSCKICSKCFTESYYSEEHRKFGLSTELQCYMWSYIYDKKLSV